jgi:DNA-damage-inducible protein D
MTYMGYGEWENFSNALGRAQDACQNSGIPMQSHFQKTVREVEFGSDAKRSVEDIKPMRYACYLVVQNGDPRKETAALLQSYFALQNSRLYSPWHRSENYLLIRYDGLHAH